jgi:hypothetical protein
MYLCGGSTGAKRAETEYGAGTKSTCQLAEIDL